MPSGPACTPTLSGQGLHSQRVLLQAAAALAPAKYPSVTSPLCAANAARTSFFSRSGTLKKSSVRPSSAATSSNWAGEIFSSRWATSKPTGVLPGFVAAYRKGPPATLQTHSVRINFRPGSLVRFLVCHSWRAGFFDPWPTMGFCTTASLKWSTTAAMANAPPSRSYRLVSVIVEPPRLVVSSWLTRPMPVPDIHVTLIQVGACANGCSNAYTRSLMRAIGSESTYAVYTHQRDGAAPALD